MVVVMVMEQPIYGDVLFAINFTMDFLTLFVVGKIMHRQIRPARYCLAAAIGAVYGVAAVFLCGNSIFSLLINLAVSALMCYTAYGGRVLSCTALFYCTGCLLGGGMTALYHLVNKSFAAGAIYAYGSVRTLSESIPLGWMAVMAALVGIAAVAGGRISGKSQTARIVTVYASAIGGRTVEFEALTDSGNLLTEPMSGAPVIIADRRTVSEIAGPELMSMMEGNVSYADKLPPELMRRIRLIPMSGIGGDGVLVGIMPKRITIGGVCVKACIALDRKRTDENPYGGCAAIVPAVLCPKAREKFRITKLKEIFGDKRSNTKTKSDPEENGGRAEHREA